MFTSVSARSANAYKRVSLEVGIDQANPHRLIDMLFDGLLTNVNAARGALARGDIAAKCQHIVTAVRILEEGLKGSLNMSEGGDLAANLEGVYDYCVFRLTMANLRNDDVLMQEVSQIIAPIASGWKQIGSPAVPAQHLM